MDRIGRYEILGKLGQGAFGTVYQGRDPSIDRMVAIKVVSETLAGDQSQLARFRREAESAGKLNHRNIITIYELGSHEGRPFIAMEYLEGMDLAEVLSRSLPMSLEQRVDALIQVAEGLHYAHARGIVHRDIKPGNIRLLDDGTVKIMDFGIARVSNSNMTNTGLILGTVNYMAPEMLQGKPIDARADQFSLGVTAYELLSRRRPFPGDTISAVLYAIVHEQPLPMVEVQSTAYPALDAIVSRALAKDPALRWPSCQALAQAMRELLGRSTTMNLARPASDGASHELLETIASTALGPKSAAAAKPNASPGTPAAPRTRAPVIALIVGAVVVLLAGGYLALQRRGPTAPAAGEATPALTPVAIATASPVAGSGMQALLGEAQALEQKGDLQAARAKCAEALAADPGDGEAQNRLSRLDAAITQLTALKEQFQASLQAGDREKARALVGLIESLAAADPELARMRADLQVTAPPTARPTPAVKPTPAAAGLRPEVAAAAAELTRLFKSPTLDEAMVTRRAGELRRLDPSHPWLVQADRLMRGLAAVREAEAALAPETGLAALDGLDLELPAVRASRERLDELVRRRERAQADLLAARTSLDAGRRDEALKLARKAVESWPPLQAKAQPILEQADRPAPTTAPTSAPGAEREKSPTPDERGAVEAVLRRYSLAMKNKDLGALKASWPGLPADRGKTIAESFRFAKDHEVDLRISDFKTDGEHATVTCTRKDRIETNEGQVISNETRAVFELTRKAGTWVIVDLQ